MQYRGMLLSVFISSCLILSTQAWAEFSQTYQFYTHSLIPKLAYRLKQNGESAAGLGAGWSSDTDALAGQCLLGTMDYVGASSASLSMDVLYNYQDFLQQLNFYVDSSFTGLGFQARVADNYSHMLEDTAYTQTFIYRATVFLKNRHFVPPKNKSPLTWIGQQYAQDPVSFRANCGDKFISEQKIGGVLYVAVKFKFHTAKEKSNFNLSVSTKVGSLIKLNVSLYKGTSLLGRDSSIAVSAFQIGGDPTKLGKILGAKSGAITVPVLNCRLDNLNACHETINQIVEYATASNPGDFPTQFKIDDQQSLVGPGVIKNILQNVTTVAPVKIGPSLATQAIIDARTKLSKLYQTALIETNEVNNLLANHVPLSFDYAQKLTTMKKNINHNDTVLRDAGGICYTGNLSHCLVQAAAAENQLLLIDISPFEKRFSTIGIHRNFLLPYSENQFIFGLPEKYKQSEIYYTKTLTNSKIDFENPTQYFMATSTDGGLSYRGYYYNRSTGYLEYMTFVPDFKVEGLAY